MRVSANWRAAAPTRLGRLAKLELLEHARFGLFSIPDLTGFVDLLAGQAEVRSSWNVVPIRNVFRPASPFTNLTTLLRGVVFVSQPDLGAGLDLERLPLRATSLIRPYPSTGARVGKSWTRYLAASKA